MSNTRLVFRAAERAVPALQRGWRTPDPSPRASSGLPKCVAKDFIVNYVSSDTASTRTPSPSSSVVQDDNTSPSQCRIRTPSPDCNYYSAERVLPSIALGDQIVLCVPCFVPSDEPYVSWSVSIDETWSDAEVVANVDETAWPTRGSVGHPQTCAEACKYFRKARGCKDAENCDRCHLCSWKQSEQGRKAGGKRGVRRKSS